MKTALQIGLISCLCIGGYAAMRSLPDTKCAFLHYDYAGETPDGAEFCGDDSAARFYDMSRLSFPVQSGLRGPEEVVADREQDFVLTLETLGGKPITPGELAVVHTEKVHLFVVHESLRDYHHIHPEALGESGQFGFAFKPALEGRYTLYAEVVLRRSRSVVIATEAIRVGTGDTPAGAPAASAQSTAQVVHGVSFTLELPDGMPALNTGGRIVVTAEPAHGAPGMRPVFEKTMGAYCHLAAFDGAGHGFAHLHPLNGLELAEGNRQAFEFVFNTSVPGSYALWAQFLIDGEDVFVPFHIDIADALAGLR